MCACAWGELSYGRRRRIELARLVSDPVDPLLLDEPTNHLAPALVEESGAPVSDRSGSPDAASQIRTT
ncbi:ATP-binding cassette domain-containing protein [Streptomyces albicerus]|uniref:ATP-binding cassette domain-containing protein n=1 Tax=Streptomyces albicerus TaxID=2569859 RepID=UPI00384C8B8A